MSAHPAIAPTATTPQPGSINRAAIARRDTSFTAAAIRAGDALRALSTTEQLRVMQSVFGRMDTSKLYPSECDLFDHSLAQLIDESTDADHDEDRRLHGDPVSGSAA